MLIYSLRQSLSSSESFRSYLDPTDLTAPSWGHGNGASARDIISAKSHISALFFIRFVIAEKSSRVVRHIAYSWIDPYAFQPVSSPALSSKHTPFCCHRRPLSTSAPPVRIESWTCSCLLFSSQLFVSLPQHTSFMELLVRVLRLKPVRTTVKLEVVV